MFDLMTNIWIKETYIRVCNTVNFALDWTDNWAVPQARVPQSAFLLKQFDGWKLLNRLPTTICYTPYSPFRSSKED